MSRSIKSTFMTSISRLVRCRIAGAIVLALVALPLAACSTMGDSIPANLGGLPATAPERPAAPPVYPAVHDMPPPRDAPMLDEDEQKRLERDLISARNRQQGRKPTTAGQGQKP